MPINKIKSSSRAAAAIAAVMLGLSSAGLLTLSSQVTPKIIHEQVDRGEIPPVVQLTIDKLILPWEGLVLRAHWDRFAKKYDICHGETLINGKPVTPDMVFTPAECKKILIKRVIHDYYLPLVDELPGYIKAPMSVQAAMLSGAYNFGVGSRKPRRGQLGSRAADFVMAHKYRDACIAQTAWNKAGGDIVPGLVKRREMGDAQRIGEAELCVSGL